jgi:hypothetical protein
VCLGAVFCINFLTGGLGVSSGIILSHFDVKCTGAPKHTSFLLKEIW